MNEPSGYVLHGKPFYLNSYFFFLFIFHLVWTINRVFLITLVVSESLATNTRYDVIVPMVGRRRVSCCNKTFSLIIYGTSNSSTGNNFDVMCLNTRLRVCVCVSN